MQKNYMGAGIIFDLYLLYQRQYLSEHTNFLISFLPLQNVYQCITKIGDYNLNLFSYTVVSCKWFLNFFKSKVQFENFKFKKYFLKTLPEDKDLFGSSKNEET